MFAVICRHTNRKLTCGQTLEMAEDKAILNYMQIISRLESGRSSDTTRANEYRNAVIVKVESDEQQHADISNGVLLRVPLTEVEAMLAPRLE